MHNVILQEVSDPLKAENVDPKTLLDDRSTWIRKTLGAAGIDRPLRILFATTGLGPGGAEHQVLRLMPYLAQLGMHVEHVYFDRSHALLPHFKTAGLTTHFIEMAAQGPFRFIREARRLIKAQNYDVVVSFIGMTRVYIRLASILAGVPVIVACSRSRRMRADLPFRLVMSALNPFTDAWIANAATNADALEQLWLMNKPDIYFVPNVLDCTSKDYVSGKPFESDLADWISGRMVVGTCGWISEPKNFDMFLDLAKRIAQHRQDVCFVIAGGPRPSKESHLLAERLHLRVENEGLSGFVKLLGPREDVADIMPNFTLLAYTSIWEGCPNAVIEALRASLPVVMTGACDTRLLIEEGENGYVVEKNDLDAMAARVNELLDNAQVRLDYGKRSRQLAEQHFSAENNAWKYALIFLNYIVAKSKNGKTPR